MQQNGRKAISILDYRAHGLAGDTSHKEPKWFFDSASIGRSSRAARSEVEKAEKSETRDWDILRDEVRVKFATLLQTSINHVELYYNTTAAIQRVFQVALAHSSWYAGPLLTTDEEYPGIAALLDESWPGSVFIARISNAISIGEGETVSRTIVDSCRLVRPSVIYLSHVMRYSGFCIPASTIRQLRELSPRSLIIIDGAQAAGNIRIETSVLADSDFYITSGHKWLGGEPTLGLVYASRWANLIADPAQSYSRKRGSGGTGSLRALVSASKALDEFLFTKSSRTWKPQERMLSIAEHNRDLAHLFIREVGRGLNSGRRYPHPIQFAKVATTDYHYRSGIVVIGRVPPYAKVALERKGYDFTPLEAEALRDSSEGIGASGKRYSIDFPSGTNSVPRIEPLKLPETRWPHYALHDSICLRFCFHHFHSSLDVVRLAKDLIEAVKITPSPRKQTAVSPTAKKPKRRATR